MARSNQVGEINSKIDEYIEKAQPFSRPILKHLRNLVHKGCPGVKEEIKWQQPFFLYRDSVIFHVGASKNHCRLHFWGKEMSKLVKDEAAGSKDAMFDRITDLADLPSDQRLLSWIQKSKELIDSGNYTSPMAARPKTAVLGLPELPQDFKQALQANRQAKIGFSALSPSCKREYLEWITEAKRPETRAKRIVTATHGLPKASSETGNIRTPGHGAV